MTPPTLTAAAPAVLVELVRRSTDRLGQTIESFSAGDIAGDSGLPGWSRGHLLTHLANNAEGLTRLILGSMARRPLPMYASAEARNGDIDAGSVRSASIIVAHLQLAIQTLDAAVAVVTDWNVLATFHTVTGAAERPLADVLRMRLREVAIHHVDLDTNHRFEDEDGDVLTELTRDAAQRFSPFGDRPIDLHIDGNWTATISPERASNENVTIDLSGGPMVGWLTGRATPDSTLPTVPGWG